jgi:hypothetical protein
MKTIVMAIPKAPAVPSTREALFATLINTLGDLPNDEEVSIFFL